MYYFMCFVYHLYRVYSYMHIVCYSVHHENYSVHVLAIYMWQPQVESCFLLA